MKIRAAYNTLNEAISTLTGVITDKMASDTLKNIIFSVKKDNSVAVMAYNTIVTCYTPLASAIVDWQGADPEDTYFQLKSDLIQTLATFKSLKRTVADWVEIELTDINALLTVHETARDENDINAAKYDQPSSFRIPAPKFPSATRKELESKQYTSSGTLIPSADLLIYLSTLLGTIPPDSRDSIGTRIMAVGDLIYTAPQLYFAIMINKLPDVFRGFVLTSSAASFLKGFLALDDNVNFEKQELESGNVLLKFANSYSVAYITAAGTKNALDCSQHRNHTKTGIAIDKGYFADILKRATLGGAETCNIDLKIGANGECSGEIMSKAWKQPLTVLSARLVAEEFQTHPALKSDQDGERLELSFSIRPDLMSKLLFMQSSDFSDVVYLYFEPSVGNGIKMAACDNTQVWQTKINSLTTKRNDFNW